MKETTSLLPPTFLELSHFRSDDLYLPEINWKSWIESFFPPTTAELVQSLSNTTAAFYGLMLNEAGKEFGHHTMDSLSKKTLHALGQRTVQQLVGKDPDVEMNAKGIAKFAIISIYIASPEYKFEVLRYDTENVDILVKGIDRYHRIALALGIEEYISSPIAAFITGINDELGLAYQVSMTIKDIDKESKCLYELQIKR